MLKETGKTEKNINIYSLNIIGRMQKIANERGFGFLFRKMWVFLLRYLYSLTILRFRKERFFIYRNEKYSYFYHPYNFTWDNERAVEIPIVLRMLESFKEGKILEVGNVLSHYYPVKWDVLDKFEDKAGIIKQDVVDFNPSNRYDLIISISTLEHIGFDDDIKNPHKIIEALCNLKQNCLKPEGMMFFTMPLGYNLFMDDLLFNDKLGFNKKYYLKKISKNEWVEVEEKELGDTTYGTTYIEASTIVIAEFMDGG